MTLRVANIRKTLTIVGCAVLVAVQAAHANQTALRQGALPASIAPSVPVLYVGDATTNAVYLFDARNLSRPPIGKLTEGVGTPYNMTFDAHGFLYIANGSAVEVYQPGTLKLVRSITDVPRPGGVGVGPRGTLAISGLGTQGGLLAIYDNGSRTPTRTIMFPPGQIKTEVTNPVFDSLGNVYVGVHQYPRGPAKIFKFAPGSTQGVDTGLPFCFALGIDAQDNIYVSFGSGINVYHPGSLTAFRRITNGLVITGELAISRGGTLFVPNAEQQLGAGPPGNVVEFAPHGSTPIATMHQACCDGGPLSVALHGGS